MKQKKWTSKEKLRIVLEGIKGQVPLGELCARNGVSQAQYYKWRDRLLKEGEKAFEYGGVTANEERLRQEPASSQDDRRSDHRAKKTEDDIASLL